jgi:zinc/manganese transport system permease protein
MTEMFQLDFMRHAFMACLLMGILLSYLGIHVVGRGIVFVDLALGQISSLGVALSEFLHVGEAWLPIVFTVLGAILLSFIHIRDRRLKLEAVIGIIYVVAAAVTVLIISKTPHGESNIQEVLFGALLAVTTDELIYLGIVVAVLGVLHFLFRKPIFEITERLREGDVADFGFREQAWNFFFYVTIGLAIVFSVRIGGVLPVFSYLVVPAVAAILVARRTAAMLLAAGIFSIIAGYGGLWYAYTFDFPAGPSIVACFGVIFCFAAAVRWVMNRKSVQAE